MKQISPQPICVRLALAAPTDALKLARLKYLAQIGLCDPVKIQNIIDARGLEAA